MLKEQIAELFLQYRQDLCDTEFAPEPFEQTTDIDLHNRYARKVLALFPQGEGGLMQEQLIQKLCDICGDEELCRDQGLGLCDTVIAEAEFIKQHEAQALKEQMERVMGVIDNKIRLLRQERLSSYDSNEMREIEASIYAVENLKSQPESE